MADEFGKDPSIYVFPEDHEDGTPFPDDFWERIAAGLESVGIDWEFC